MDEEKSSEDPPEANDEENRESTTEEQTPLVADLIWTSGAPVQRQDENGPFLEVLSLEEGHVRLDYFNSGNAPVLDTHDSDSVTSILGIVEKAWIDSTEQERIGKASIRFSPRESVRDIFEDIQQGIIRNCSVGYRIYHYEERPPVEEGGLRVLVATDWEPVELSLCPVGADSRAGFRNMEKRIMDEKTKETKKEATQPSPDLVTLERQRGIEIRRATKAASLEEDLADDWISRGTSIDEARKQIIDKLAERSKAQSQCTVAGGSYDEKEVQRKGIVDALLSRHDPNKYPLSDQGKRFRHLSLVEMARRTLGPSAEYCYPDEVITRSMQSTSDFPMLLQHFTERVLRDSYESMPKTWKPWTRQTTSKDFRPKFKIQLSDVPTLEKVNETGEFKSASLDESAEFVKVETYGRVINISRQALVNDDLNAFSSIPGKISFAADALISRTVYGLLAANPHLHADRIKCFDPKHKNVGTPGPISLDSLSQAREMMALQMTPKGQEPMRLSPRYLITTVRNQTRAEQFLSNNFVAGVIEGAIEQKINPFRNMFEPIIEPLLDLLIGPECWFMSIDSAIMDTLEISFLNGQDTVYLESEMGFSVDGMRLKGRIDFGAAIIDHRGLFFNAGK